MYLKIILFINGSFYINLISVCKNYENQILFIIYSKSLKLKGKLFQFINKRKICLQLKSKL